MDKVISTLSKKPYLFKLRLVWIGIIVVSALVFLYLKIIPFGQITYSRAWPRGLATGKGFIYDFKPAERIDSQNPAALKLVADPVYFSLYAPRAFDSAEITIKYRDNLATETPIIEVGILRDKLTGQYDLKPIQNNIVDSYRRSLPRIDDSGGRLVMQTEKYYDNSREFENDLQAGNLRACPGGPTACVAVYNYSLGAEFRLPDYIPLVPAVIDQPLRGAHQFYVYFQPGAWRLGFDFSDLNLDRAPDPITVNVYSGDNLVATKTIDDVGITQDGGEVEMKSVILSGQESFGLHRVEIKVSDDIVMAKLTSSSNKISFINKIWPVSGRGDMAIFTDASYIGVSTVNPASLGEINFAGRQFSVDKTYQQFSFKAETGINKIVLDRDDIVLENSGAFSFSSADLINPGAKKVDRYFTLSDDIKYIIAGYEQPLTDDGIKTAHAILDMKGAAIEKNKYTFIISVPGLNGLSGSENYLDIQEIKINLKVKSLFRKIKEIIISR